MATRAEDFTRNSSPHGAASADEGPSSARAETAFARKERERRAERAARMDELADRRDAYRDRHAYYYAEIDRLAQFFIPKGASVLEIIADFDGDTWRAVYTVAIAQAVYVLHFFQKKSKTGIATPRKELDLIKRRLRDAIEHGKGR